MTAEVHAFTRPGTGGRPPMVPAKVKVQDAPDFRFPISLLDSEWYHSCSREEALAGINLLARAIHQERAGSLPNADGQLARLADFGRDVASWQAAKAKALEGWTLCADDRWHHPEIARNVLHIWIGRLEKRRASAYGNASKADAKNDFGLASIQEDIDEALQALRTIDPQDGMLRDAAKRATRWRALIAEIRAPAPLGEIVTFPEEPNRGPNRPPIREPLDGGPKRSEAKGSESIPLSHSESGAREPHPTLFEQEAGLARGEPPHPDDEGPPAQLDQAFPPDAFDRWWEDWPNKVGMGAARRTFAKVQKSGVVGFGTLMVEAKRYRSCKPVERAWCNPATWLNQERWRDEWPTAGPPGQPQHDARPSRGKSSAIYGIRRRTRGAFPPEDRP